MLWARVRYGRASHLFSMIMTGMLLMLLVSPGVAAFAGETTSTPAAVPAVTTPVAEPVAPADPKTTDPAPVTEPPATPVAQATATATVTGGAAEAPAIVPAQPQTKPADKSVEAAPVTAAALVSSASSNNGGGPRSDFPPPITVGEGCDLTTIATFWAGQNYEAGTVSVHNDATNLYVTFTTTGGWTMSLTHLYVGLTEPSSYAPGQFPYQTTHDPAVTSFTYTIPLADIGAVFGDTVYIAAHADVSNGTQSETAWAGQGQWPGLLFSHTVQICVEPNPADLTVVKFNDLNGNGVMDQGEPGLPGIDFTVTKGDTTITQTTDGSGQTVFVDLADGTWTVSESLPSGWVATTEIPFDIALMAGQDQTVHVGNQEVVTPPDVTKTFRLFYPAAPAGVTFFVGYTDGETSSLVELTGSGPYEAQVVFPHGTEITVSWYALYGSQLVLLGTGSPEVLTMDVVNTFEYTGAASGYKFNDLNADGVWGEGEPGIAGWTISLYRQSASTEPAALAVPAGFELYAVTTTASDGSYQFSGLLPGTYYVAEENRGGWFMTVGPDAPFVISNGVEVAGLTFGNAEEALPFTAPDLAIEKVADVATADPGQLITYTLTYRNVGEGVATDFRIVDDFDQRYVTVVDSGGGTVVGGTIVWDLSGPLSAADGAKTITYTVRVLADMPEGSTQVKNVAVISHPDDTNLTNNTARETVVVDNPALPFTPKPTSEEFLPFTGTNALLIALALALAVLLGAGLRLASRRG